MAATTIAVLGLALSAAATTKGVIDKKNAQKKLDNLETPEYSNAFKDIAISTQGSDLIREEGQRTTANLVDAARSAGARGVSSSIPKIVALSNENSRRSAAQLDDQIINRDYAIAREEGNLRTITENRYSGDIQGLGQAISVADQNIWNGIRGIGTGIGSLSRVDLDNKDSEDNNSHPH